MEGLEKQIIKPPDQRPELLAMKKKIDRMQGLYLVLFITSLVLIVGNWQGGIPTYLWAVALGSAVITRIARQSLVAKYNSALLGGGPAPLA